ncbi:kinetochore protein Mis12/MTW1, partial [Phenoliferia sp. Uapishka_3]
MANARPLEELSPEQIKAVKASILTEHFGWAPETFAKQGMDLANVSLYAATEAIAASLMEKSGPPHNLDEDEIQKGVYRLETLLEDAIDRHFDLYELYVLRNTFKIDTDLLPYLALKHQEHIDESLKDADAAALEEYETELRLFEEEVQTERELACAAEYVRRKVEDVQERAAQVGYMSSAGRPLTLHAPRLSCLCAIVPSVASKQLPARTHILSLPSTVLTRGYATRRPPVLPTFDYRKRLDGFPLPSTDYVRDPDEADDFIEAIGSKRLSVVVRRELVEFFKSGKDYSNEYGDVTMITLADAEGVVGACNLGMRMDSGADSG